MSIRWPGTMGGYGYRTAAPVPTLALPLTVEAWVRPWSATKTGAALAVAYDYSWIPVYALGLLAGKPCVWTYDGTQRTLVGPDALPLDEWAHLACVVTTTGATLYVDGLPVASDTRARGPLAYAGEVATIGSINWLGEWEYGAFYQAETRVWSVARTQTEIAQNRYADLSGGAPGLAGLWRFDEGAGTTVADAVGGCDFTLLQSAWWSAEAPPMPVMAYPEAVPLAAQAVAPSGWSPRQPDAVAVPVAAPAPAAHPLMTPLQPVQLWATTPAPQWVDGWFVAPVELALTAGPPVGRTAIPETVPQTPFYRLVLTGAADGQPDAVLPMESFEARARSGEPTYLRATVPWTPAHAAAVAARPNGQLVVYRGTRTADGLEVAEEILRANLEDIRTDRGGRSASITLVGHKQTTNTNPVGLTLSGTIYRRETNGLRAFRVAASSWLRPGDTVMLADVGETLTVGVVSWIVGPYQETVEIEEAA